MKIAIFLHQIRQLIAKDQLGEALLVLRSLLKTSPLLDEVLLHSGRFHEIRKQIRLGMVSNADATLKKNQFREGLLDLIREIEELTFPKTNSSDFKQGLLLYHIPQVMMLEDETRCIVRVALNHDVLLEDLKISDNVKKRLLKKVSKSMQIELNDPSGGQFFAIRTTSKAVQTVDLDGDEYTEWRFYIKPLIEGIFLLEIKAAIIELVEGERELREKVFEEEVEVISQKQILEITDTRDAPFKIAGEALVFSPNTRPHIQNEKLIGGYENDKTNILKEELEQSISVYMADDKDRISNSKNIVSGSNIHAGGNVHIGDNIHIHQSQTTPPLETDASRRLRELISKNQIERALEELRQLTAGRQDGLQDEVDGLARQWNKIGRDRRMGTLSFDQENVAQNRITAAMLEVVAALEKA
jgi:hypothetical protein